MLDTLITSKTRVKLLLKFFLNSNSSSYLRGLEQEFGESTNAIRLELNRFEQAGLLTSDTRGNRKYFRANTSHPLYHDIHNILLKYIGFDQIIEKIINKLGEMDRVYVTGNFARGTDSRIIDLVFIGNRINKDYLMHLVEKCEELINRKIRYLVFDNGNYREYLKEYRDSELLLLWKR
ncbi:MAG TPA: ArsR family transcriptional regulator [Bacteroidetes bacterium]|nr:ArsR family transcriptional regulator [Bacteroidota bacterium]